MKNLKKVLLFSFVSLFFGNAFSVTPSPKFANEIAEEIYTLKHFDKDFKTRTIDMKNQSAKKLFDNVDIKKLIADEPSIVKQKLLSFFLKVYPGGPLRSTKSVVMVTSEKAPKLYAVVKELADNLNMPAPTLFITENRKIFDAFSCSLTKNLSLMCLGENLVNNLSIEELRTVIAHELGHIKKNHIQKQLVLALFPCTSILLPVFSQYCEKQADMIAVKATGDPQAMADTVKKFKEISSGKKDFDAVEAYIKKTFSNNPKLRKKFMLKLNVKRLLQQYEYSRTQHKLFKMHPSHNTRIKYLEKKAKKMKKELDIKQVASAA